MVNDQIIYIFLTIWPLASYKAILVNIRITFAYSLNYIRLQKIRLRQGSLLMNESNSII